MPTHPHTPPGVHAARQGAAGQNSAAPAGRDIIYVVVRSGHEPVYGGEKSTLATAAALSARGWRPRFVVTTDDDFAHAVRDLGFPCEVIPVDDPFANLRAASWLRRLAKLADLLRINAAVYGNVRAAGAAVVHSVATPALYCAVLGARLAGARVVYHVRGASRGLRVGPHEELAMVLADRTIAVSAALKAQLAGTGRPWLRAALDRRVAVVTNGFDFAAIDAAAGPLAVRDAGDFHMLFVAAIWPAKGQLRFLERVLPRVLAEIPAARVTLIGAAHDPEYAGACHAAVARLGLDKAVTFAGYLAQDATYRAFRGADVLVLPSEREGLPRCAIEAHALGLPVVAADVVGVAEVVDAESGFLVASARIEEMAAPLVRLAREPALRARLGAAGAARVRARFGLDANVRAVEQLYGELRS